MSQSGPFPLIFLWSLFGTSLWGLFTLGSDSPFLEDDLSIGQLFFVRAFAGPVVWVWSILQLAWLALGYLGPRDGG